MPKLAVLPYSLREDETEFMNGLWYLLNDDTSQHPIHFRYHFKYEGGIWNVYIAFAKEDSFHRARIIYEALAAEKIPQKYSKLLFLE